MKKLFIILTLSLVCVCCSVNFIGCGNNNDDKNNKTLYTETIPMIFIIKTNDSAAVGKKFSTSYLHTAIELIRRSDTIDKADEIYRQTYEKYNYDMTQYNEYGGIKANSIDIIHGGETVLIITYKDYDANVASKKLDAVIQAAQIILHKYLSSDFETAELIPITTEYFCSI